MARNGKGQVDPRTPKKRGSASTQLDFGTEAAEPLRVSEPPARTAYYYQRMELMRKRKRK